MITLKQWLDPLYPFSWAWLGSWEESKAESERRRNIIRERCKRAKFNKIHKIKHDLLKLNILLIKNNTHNVFLNKYLDAECLIISLKYFASILTQHTCQHPLSKIYVLINDRHQFNAIDPVLEDFGFEDQVRLIENIKQIRRDASPKILVILNRNELPGVKATATELLSACCYFIVCIDETSKIKTYSGSGAAERGYYSLKMNPNTLHKTIFLICLLLKAKMRGLYFKKKQKALERKQKLLEKKKKMLDEANKKL